ncbi:MAG: copper chaperone PCu(A)C [Frankiales bacterium]|nr:copper chaperone PCu(A)C [Frankiales bacterium]
MTSHRTSRRVGFAVLLAVGLSGCGTGLNAQTYQARNLGNASNAQVGNMAVRNAMLLTPSSGRTYEVGTDVRGTFQVVNLSRTADQLIEVTSPQAGEVVLLQDGAPTALDVPAEGSTEQRGSFILRGLTGPLVTGEYVTMTFRFATAGTVDVLVPVATTGRSNRPGRTGEPGSPEGDPALQGPAGGHSETGGGGATEPTPAG